MQAALIALMLAVAVLAPALGAPARAGEPAHREGSWRAGIEVGSQVDARDLGLPRYRGAFEQPNQDGDRQSLKLGLHGGAFGLQLAVQKLYSEDPAQDVARFYQAALARHGTVLDCSRDAPRPPPVEGQLRCDRDGAVDGAFVYKAGVPGNFRAVAVDRAEGLTRIQLVRLRLKDD